MICRNARSSALTRGNPDVSALRNDDASVVGLRLHHADALLDKLIQIHIGIFACPHRSRWVLHYDLPGQSGD
jgi:hypothetical protein